MDKEEAVAALLAPSHQYASEIKAICKPLFDYLGFNCFSYHRFYDKKRYLLLSTHPDISERYWLEKWYAYDPNLIFPELYGPGRYFWDVHYDCELTKSGIKMIYEKYNLRDGLNIFSEHDDYQLAVSFAGPGDRSEVCKVYRDHMYFLDQFVEYFQHRAQGIIKQCEKNCIEIMDIIQVSDFDHVTEEYRQKVLSNNAQKQAAFLELMQTIPQAKKPEDKVSAIEKLPDLSLRQSQCAHLLLDGKTAEESGKILKISKRTVEEHIKAMRQKLQCANRTDLIMKLAALLKDKTQFA